MTNSLTNIPASVPTSNSVASPSSTAKLGRRFALAAAAVGLVAVSIFTVSAVRGDTGTNTPAEAPTVPAPVAAAPAIPAPVAAAPAVALPECVVGAPC